MIKGTKNYSIICLVVLSLFVQVRNTSVEIKDVSKFLPLFIGVFSCPAETYFSKDEENGVVYKLSVQVYVSNTDNLPILVAGGTTDKKKIQIKGNTFDINLSKSSFKSLFGETVKKQCDYTWKNLEGIKFKKENIKSVDLASVEFVSTYKDDSPESVSNTVIQFKADGAKDSFKVGNVNLLQLNEGMGAAVGGIYKIELLTTEDVMTYNLITSEQDYLKKLYEGTGDGYTPWYEIWWIWLSVGLGVILIVGIIVFVCFRGGGEESYDNK